ncbi:type II toxin-antitoxin system VapC family toxin [Thermococcus kodakarensis]|uniref:type II toxin-antitoxin system VapC family toxin n=1 Tax=Thermococcus kodakarensis TaxID=311400 RepID=UPI00064F26EB|nr:type II toxin-antitoxin system VapC family toxin [Thermococcus kodakarensis]WCN28901.1 type II toxin-antitoxin system VapC family toxin [Thermococcus kodakarensis]WCN31203.1 type II toxin-antitoxin system VapC family toxin [Thermococcus kodakarensis]
MSTSKRERVVIDSNIWVEVLSGNSDVIELLDRVSEDFTLCITPTIYSEVSFVILGHYFTSKTGKKGVYALKKELKKNPELYEIVEKFDELLYELSEAGLLEFLGENEEVIRRSRKLRREYRLLPNDAMILAVCDVYGISKIVTLDDDFLRTHLEVLR